MAVKYTNNASTSLSSAITNSDTSIAVVSAADFPAITGGDYFFATFALSFISSFISSAISSFQSLS